MDILPDSTVLVVDDTPENLTAMCCLLEGVCNVAAASNGAEALVTASDLKPDLILLDILMPGMDGFATCRRLKQNPETATIPVIFVTTLDQPEDKLEGFEAGAVDYVTKPFHAGEIRARVRTQLRIRELEKQLQARISGLSGELDDFRAQFAFLANNSADILMACDAEDRVRTANPAWAEITASPVDGILGRPFPSIVYEMDRDRVSRLLLNARNTRTRQLRFELRFSVPGGIRWMRVAAHFDYSADGLCEGWTAVLADITDLMDQAEVLKKSRAALIAANASHMEYLQEVAHNLRTPLHAIITGLDALRQNPAWNPADRESVDTASSGAHQLSEQVERLLRIFAGREGDGAGDALMRGGGESAPKRSFDVPVLVADDSSVNLRIMQHLLKRCGFSRIELVADGAVALEKFKAGNHPLVLLDCQMPVMDGYEACRAILAAAGEKPPVIIAVTAAGLPENRQHALDSGFLMQLDKPLTADRLRSALENFGWVREEE